MHILRALRSPGSMHQAPLDLPLAVRNCQQVAADAEHAVAACEAQGHRQLLLYPALGHAGRPCMLTAGERWMVEL